MTTKMYEGKVGFKGCQYQEQDGTSCGRQIAGELELKGSVCELCADHLRELSEL